MRSGFTRADRRRLLDAGVELRFYNPPRIAKGFANLLRDHRKLLVLDGTLAYVGGAGLTHEFAPQDATRPVARAHGPDPRTGGA